MGALEEAIRAGDTEKQAELSSFFRDAQANHLTLSDLALSPDRETVVIKDPAKRQAYFRLMATARADEAHRARQGAMLSQLVKMARGLDPNAQREILGRAGINFAPRDRAAEAERLAVLKARLNPRTQREPVSLDPDVVEAIGTPEFTDRLRNSAGRGIDRRSVESLLNLDRRERELALRSQAKPAKLSAAAQKLRELEALGVPLTEDVVRSVYTPTAVVPQPLDAGRRGRRISLSALAGLTGEGSGEELASVGAEEPEPGGEDERRSKLRAILRGGSEY